MGMRYAILLIVMACIAFSEKANALLVTDGTFQVYGPFSNDQNGFPNVVFIDATLEAVEDPRINQYFLPNVFIGAHFGADVNGFDLLSCFSNGERCDPIPQIVTTALI
jgi:hypothetical protein